MLDLFPDALTASGSLREGSLVERFITLLIRADLQTADSNVFLGAHLLEAARRRFGRVPRATIIPVGADASLFTGTNAPDLSCTFPLRLLYCGNLGRLHDVDTIADAIKQGLPSGLTCTFRGNGSGFHSLLSAAEPLGPLPAVLFGGNLAEAEWIAEMRRSQLALVTVRPGAESVVMPSKTYSAMSAGQAIIGICPARSDLASLIRHYDCGWQIEPGQPRAIRSLLSRLIANPVEVQVKRENALRAARTAFDSPTIAGQWCEVVNQVTAARASRVL